MEDLSARDKLLRKLSQLTERETATVLLVLQPHNPSIMITRDNHYLTRMIDEIYLEPEDLLVLLNDVKAILVADKDLDWILNSQRVSLWFFNYLSNNNATLPSLQMNILSSYIDNLITAFDCAFTFNPDKRQMSLFWEPDSFVIGGTRLSRTFDFAFGQKLAFLTNAKRLYNSIYTERKNTDWIDIKDEEQLHWALDYLDKTGMLIKPQLFLAENNEDIFAQICATLDTIDNYHDINNPYAPSLNKKYFISSMRKAWSQKKFRDKKDTDAAQDLLLSRVSKKQLMNLSKSYGINAVEMLSIIIDQAYEKSDL